MTIKELKEKLMCMPDNLDVKMLEEGGWLIDADDAYVDEDDLGNKTFVISH